MENLLFTVNVMLPILIPVLIGYFLRRLHFFSEEFLKQGNKLVFRLFLPILLFSNLYLADLSLINWSLVGYAAISILGLYAVGFVITLFFPDKRQKGVMWQASFRSNYAIIGIPLATMLGGAEAGASAAVVAAVSVPLFNTLGVIALSVFDTEGGKKVSVLGTLKKVITNPLIIGVLLGLAVCGINTLIGMDSVKAFFSGTYASTKGMKFIPDTISSLAKVATPFALVVLGGRFEFSAVKKLWKHLTVACSFRLVITPAVLLVIAYFLGFNSSTDFAILIALFATPIAVATAPMAAEMGQDDELAGQIVVWTSALSSVTLFLIIYFSALLGIF